MDAEQLANRARKEIGPYCYDECRSFCCRKGYLVMKLDEAIVVTNTRFTELLQKGIMTVTKTGKYAMNMGLLEGGCPSLKDYKCTIHNRKRRPKTCREYPIFIEGNTVKISSRCLAFKEGKLYPYIHAFRRMGMTVVEGSPLADSELYKMLPDKPEMKGPDRIKGPDDDKTAIIET